MTIFWVGAVALIFLSLIVIFWPWLLKRGQHDQEQERLNVLLVKDRVAEIERDLQESILSDEDKQAAESELKKALVQEVSVASESNAQASKASSGFSLVLLLFTFIAVATVIGSYLYSNEITDIQNWQDAQARLPELGERVVRGDASLTQHEYQDFTLALRTKLAKKPDDAVGWLLLGRLYASMQNVEQAMSAFEKSLALEPDRLGTLISYSQMLIMTNQKPQILKAKQILQRALQASPGEKDAMGLLAIAAEQSGDKELAVMTWQELSLQIAPEDPLQETIKTKIEQLQHGQTELIVKVDISEQLKDKLPKEAMLFVFARKANSEMKMPAAVIRQPLSEFPVTVTLTDSNAMMASFNLSGLEEAQVVARISLDDKVDVGEQEMQGEAVMTISKFERNQINIVIDQELSQ